MEPAHSDLDAEERKLWEPYKATSRSQADLSAIQVRSASSSCAPRVGQSRQIVEAGGDSGIVLPKGPLTLLQGGKEVGFRLRVLSGSERGEPDLVLLFGCGGGPERLDAGIQVKASVNFPA